MRNISLILLAVVTAGIAGYVIVQPTEDDIQTVWNDARAHAEDVSAKLKLDQKVENFTPSLGKGAREVVSFVAGPAWFKRDKSTTVRNFLTTGSILTSYDREELKGNLKKLREAAAPHGKKLAVLFESRGCYYCKKLNTEVLVRKDIKRLMDREFELVRVDINSYSSIVDLDGGQMTETTLSKQWKVSNTPTMIFFPADRNALPGNEIELSRMSGVHEPEKVKELLYKVSAHGKDPDALKKLAGFRRLENGGSCSSGGAFNPFSCMFGTLKTIAGVAAIKISELRKSQRAE